MNFVKDTWILWIPGLIIGILAGFLFTLPTILTFFVIGIVLTVLMSRNPLVGGAIGAANVIVYGAISVIMALTS